jgi:O-antigen/teichoic acid export membrane protein
MLLLARLPPWFHAACDQAAVSGVNFLVVFVAARLLPVEAFGLFSLVWLVMLFVSNLHQSLILAPLPVIYPEKTQAEVGGYVAALWLVNRFWIVAVLVLAGVCALLWPARWGLCLAAGLAIATRFALDAERRLAYAVERIEWALIGDGLGALVLVPYLLALLFGRLAAQPEVLLLALAASSALGSALTRSGLRQHAGVRPPGAVGELLRQHGRFGGWILGSTVAMWCSNQSYPFIIAGAMGLADVALFSAAKTVLGTTHFLMQGLDAYAVPVLRRALVGQVWAHFAQRSRRVLGVGLALLVLPCLAIAIAPELILTVFYGDKYAGGGEVLRALAVIYVLVAVNRLLQIYLIALREPRAGFSANLVNAALTLGLAPLLITRYGISGALWAYALNQLISLLTFIRFAVSRSGDLRTATPVSV